MINVKCRRCGQPIPETRRSDSKFCTSACRMQFRRAYFTSPAGEFPPGDYLVFQRGAATGLVLVSFTRALRTRIRTAQASSAETLTVIGLVDADRARAERFRRAFIGDRVRGSWYHATPELLAYVARRTKPVASIDRIATEARANVARVIAAVGQEQRERADASQSAA